MPPCYHGTCAGGDSVAFGTAADDDMITRLRLVAKTRGLVGR
jgi:hypothetical protein